MIRVLATALTALAASQAHAYCIYNETDREVTVRQERHPDSSRDERRLDRSLAPGTHVCCEFHKLDCNPEGRENAVVNLEVRMPGDPAYGCGFPPGPAPNVKVTGAGTIRILRNPSRSAYPYVVRVRTHDRKDITGPRGVACTEPKQKGSK
ncbi:MAG: hypothetical protein H7Y14_05370 [Burkholderiales bacterium]|nr:hypothetical protein [Burkholderiales bacterium]